MYIASPTLSTPPAMNPATGAQAANSAAGTNNQLGPDAFIQLLTVQLQNQTPDNSMDPNQMMSELVSFNSLEQLMSINQVLQQSLGANAVSGGGGAAGASAASNSPVSTGAGSANPTQF